MFKKWREFDELKKIAAENPHQLEQYRTQQIEAIIERAPEEMRRSLRGLQFKIDCQRRIHKTPMASCISISKMMHESFHKLNITLNGGHQVSEEPTNTKTQNNIINFPIAG